MDALVVVHTETPYLELHRKGSRKYNKNKRVFESIAKEIGRQVKLDNRVYYIPGESDSPDSTLIYPAIRKHFPKMRFVSGNYVPVEGGFLRAKELLIEGGAENVGVCGVSRHSCVSDAHNLFTARPGFEMTTLEGYLTASKSMGWNERKFKEVFNYVLNSRILEDLTI